ncbi:caspase family protein [Pseudomonas umsongensis]
MAQFPVVRLGLLLALFIFTSPCYSVVLTLKPTGPQPVVVTPQGKVVSLYSRSYALVISASEYAGKDSWISLSNTKKEMDEVSDALRSNGFEVRRVIDPDGDELAKVIKSFLSNNGRDTDSRILLFYSGHGYYDKATNEAYLVPVDAMKPSSVDTNFYDKAYAIEDIKTAALRMPAKHGMFIFDNCFSGMVFKAGSDSFPPTNRGSNQTERWRYLQQNSRTPVLQFISAGGPDQLLPAVSVFVPAFVQALKGGGSRNNDGYVTGKEIGIFVSEQVTKISRTQTPYSDVLGRVLGDMVFQVSPIGSTLDESRVAIIPPVGKLASLPPESSKSSSSSIDSAVAPKIISNGTSSSDRWIDPPKFRVAISPIDLQAMVKVEGVSTDSGGCRDKDQQFGENGKFYASALNSTVVGIFDTTSGKLIYKYTPYTAPNSHCNLWIHEIFFDGGDKILVDTGQPNEPPYIYTLATGKKVNLKIPADEEVRPIWLNPRGDTFLTLSIIGILGSTDSSLVFRVFNGDGKVVRHKNIRYEKAQNSPYQRAFNAFFTDGLTPQNIYSGDSLVRRDRVFSFASLFDKGIWLEKSLAELGCQAEPNGIILQDTNGNVSILDRSGAIRERFSVCKVSVGINAITGQQLKLKFPDELSGYRHYLQGVRGENTVTIKSENPKQSKTIFWSYDSVADKMTVGEAFEINGIVSNNRSKASTWAPKAGSGAGELYFVKLK